MNANLNTALRTDEPMQNAMAILMQASQVADRAIPVPTVPRAQNMLKRGFSMPRKTSLSAVPLVPVSKASGVGGQKRSFRVEPAAYSAFSNARAPMRSGPTARMASALLMAPSRKLRAVPTVSPLDIVRARALKAQRQAKMLVGTLRARFAEAMLDMQDGRPDMERTMRAKRIHAPSLVYI